MKTLLIRTTLSLAIVAIGSAAYANEPVPRAGTTGESANRRLEVIQQHSRDGEQPSRQTPSSNNLQSGSIELRSTSESTRTTCQLRPATAGAMAQRAFADQQACERRAQ